MTVYITVRLGVDAQDRADAEDEVHAVLKDKPGYITSYRIHPARKVGARELWYYCSLDTCKLHKQSVLRLASNGRKPRCHECHNPLKRRS